MLYAYSNTDQTVAINGILTFANNGVNTCNCVSHAAGTGSVALQGTGYYLITVNADAANTTATAGNITLQLYTNGVAYAGAEATQTSESTTDIAHLSFTTLIRVLPNCCVITNNNPLALTVVNTGIAATVSNAAITVVKVK